MDITTAISGVLTERSALQQPEGISSPSYISEHMYLLTQYTSALEEALADAEASLLVKEGKLFKEYLKNMSANAAKIQIKYELAADQAEIMRLTRFCSSSWRFVSSSQSRINHLVAEAHNQI